MRSAKPRGDLREVELNFSRGFAARKFPRGAREKNNGGSAAKYRSLSNPVS